MKLFDRVKKRLSATESKTAIVLLLASSCVGFTIAHLEKYRIEDIGDIVGCFFYGFLIMMFIGAFAGVISSTILGYRLEDNWDKIFNETTIIISITVIVVCLLLLIKPIALLN